MDNVLSPEKLTHTWLEDALALLFGTLMISFGIILFRQAGALTGGTAGMAFLIHYATHLPFGVVFFAINLPFYWLSVRRMGAALVPVMSGFHDVTVVLCPAAADFPAVFIAETLHSEAVFQHTLPQRVHDLLQLSLIHI